MTETDYLKPGEEPLEPWESADSRFRRDGWRDVPDTSRSGTSVDEGAPFAHGAEFVKKIIEQVRQAIAPRFEIELEHLRRENAKLRASGSSFLNWQGLAPWIVAVQSDIFRMEAQCSIDGWDGEGAKHVLAATRANAMRFALQIPSNVPRPDIEADSDGHIIFDWQFDTSRVFTVIVDPEGFLHFAGLYSASRNSGLEPLGDTLPVTVAANLARMLAEEAELVPDP